MWALICMCCMIGGILIGMYIGTRVKHVDGLFIVDENNDEAIRWVLDMKIDPEEIPKKKEVRLKVCKMDEGVV